MSDEVVSFEDIMNDHATVLQRETDTTSLLTAQILNVNVSSLKPKLLEWASLKFPAIFPVLTVPVDVPQVCSDGVTRSIQPFVEFCIGMPLSEVLTSLSTKLIGMDVSYSYTNSSISIHVSKY
jgi:hypothetical protein